MNNDKESSKLLEIPDFNDLEEDIEVPNYDNPEIFANPQQTEKITVESEPKLAGMVGIPKFSLKNIRRYGISYLKRNMVFLIVILLAWLMLGSYDYDFPLSGVPIIGNIYSFLITGPLKFPLIYLTAAYNGPMGFYIKSGLTPYTFLVALTAKSAYILAMTGVVIPSIRGLIKDRNNEIGKYKSSALKFMETLKSITGNISSIGFILSGLGIALVLSNLLTRNGKIDKTFVLLLLALVLFKGLAGILPSALDFIIRRLMALFTRLMPGYLSNGTKQYDQLRLGAIIGFPLAIIVGGFGEYTGYMIGAIILVVGILFSLFKREKA